MSTQCIIKTIVRASFGYLDLYLGRTPTALLYQLRSGGARLIDLDLRGPVSVTPLTTPNASTSNSGSNSVTATLSRSRYTRSSRRFSSQSSVSDKYSSTLAISFPSCWHCYYTRRTMSTVFVRNVSEEDRLQINLDLTTADGGVKSLNMNRLKTEEHGVALERLRLNLSKKKSKNKKKKQKTADGTTSEASVTAESETESISLNLFHDGQILAPSIENEKAWIEGAVLRYGEEDISLAYNVPSVKLDKLPSIIMTDFPLFPSAEFEFCEMDSCEFHWLMVEEKNFDACKTNIAKGKKLDLTNSCRTTDFSPSETDVGKHVLLVCVPKNKKKEGKYDARLSDNKVKPRPTVPCPFEKRHDFTKMRSAEKQFRVVTYNLLADVYSSTNEAETYFFKHCPKEYLDMNYRKSLLLKEIIGYQADLMCFQEVDRYIFKSFLTPALNTLGFEGLVCLKAGQTSEGCATFVRRDKFRIVNQLDIVLSEYLMQDPTCEDMWEKLKRSEALKTNLEQRSSILQVTVVESLENPGKYVCLANTHLFYHPSADNIRLIHGATALRYLQTVVNSYEQEGKTVAIVFCGDFNSNFHLALYQLFTLQFVASDHVDWQSAGVEEAVNDLELSHGLTIESACGTPAYTNYTAGFKATLDYIFMDASKLKVTSVVPMPEHSDVIANVALPSIVFPSDHIALICDMEFMSS